MPKKFKATEEQFRKALLKWLNRQHQQLRANVHGDDDASLWCKEEAELVEEHIQTVESLLFVNEALKVSADEAHRQADLAYDHIEELEERLKAAQDDAKEAEAYAEELEAKLANAIDFVRRTIRYAGNNGDDFLAEKARTTLAELTSSEAATKEGGKDE